MTAIATSSSPASPFVSGSFHSAGFPAVPGVGTLTKNVALIVMDYEERGTLQWTISAALIGTTPLVADGRPVAAGLWPGAHCTVGVVGLLRDDPVTLPPNG